MVLSKGEVDSLQAVCVPLLWDNITPGLPPPVTQRSKTDRRPGPTIPMQTYQRRGGNEANNNAAHGGALLPEYRRNSRTNQQSSGSQPGLFSWLSRIIGSKPPISETGDQPEKYWEIFCCINRMYTEPLEIILQIIIRDNLRDDEKFYNAVNKAIRDASGPWLSGWLRRLFSWKTCTAMEFVEASLPYAF